MLPLTLAGTLIQAAYTHALLYSRAMLERAGLGLLIPSFFGVAHQLDSGSGSGPKLAEQFSDVPLTSTK